MQKFNFHEFIEGISPEFTNVLDASILKSEYCTLDLSESNDELNNIDVGCTNALGEYINKHIAKNDAKVAFGGYLEKRNIYKRSNHFNSQSQDERDIHLGIDLWIEAETPIFTPFNAVVHSFKNNTNYGDYGPTIILKHNINDVVFYTLYGHLSLKSIENLKVGQIFKKGEQLATLGDDSVNGNYPAHLHFQIIKDLQGNFGDYPGVSSVKDLEFYKTNCPDPNLLLKLN